VAERSNVHAEMTVICLDLSNRLRTVIVEEVKALRVLGNNRIGQIRLENLPYNDGAGSPAAPTMRSGKCFVKINMQDIHSKVPGPCDSHHGVQIRAVHINQRTTRMQKFRNLGNVTFENAQRIGVRDHDCRDIVVHELSEAVEVNSTSF